MIEPRIDDSHLRGNMDYIMAYMEEVREEALQKLTNLEIAALFEDYREFEFRYHKEMEDKSLDWRLD